MLVFIECGVVCSLLIFRLGNEQALKLANNGKCFPLNEKETMSWIRHDEHTGLPMAMGQRGPGGITGRQLLWCAFVSTLVILGACANDSQISPAPQIHHVRATAMEGGDGISWATAFTHPQDALDIALDGDQVWVAQGIYGPLHPAGSEVVRLKSGVAVLGGFVGTESEAGQRDFGSAITVLDGQESSYHVVTGADRAVIDGFTVTGGNAVGNMPQSSNGGTFSGGGMFNHGVAPEIRNCLFVRNTASYNGGAIFNENSDPLIVDCVFEENTANFGGAMDNRNSSPTVVNTKFQNNTATVSGGAVANFGGSPVFINAVFSGNRSAQVGGAVLSNTSNGIFTNCSFIGNRAGQIGGGIGTWEGNVSLTNSILWDNRSMDGISVSNVGGIVKVIYSIVQGGYAGTGNLNEYPEFKQNGHWDVDGFWVEGDYHMNNASPAVDSGTDSSAPDFDADYNPRPQALAHDMGAYERSGP